RLWCRGGRWPSSGPTTGRTLVFRPRHGRQATLRPLRDNARIPVRTTRRCPRSMGGGCGIRTRGGGCPHTISNRAPSATRPILRGKGYRKADGGCRRGREAGALHRLTPERCSTPVLRLRAQVRDEPVAGEGGHLFQRAPLLEQVARPGHGTQVVRRVETLGRLLVEAQYLWVVAADDQPGRAAHRAERGTRQVRPATPGDHGSHPIRRLRRGGECRRGTRARPEQAVVEPADLRVLTDLEHHAL